jgi:hypothetical protein
LLYRDIVTKKGYLSYPENADDVWVKRWIVFKRYVNAVYEGMTYSVTNFLYVIDLTSIYTSINQIALSKALLI